MLGEPHLTSFRKNMPSITSTVEPYIGCPYPCPSPCPWVLGGHGCNIIGNIIGNVTIFEYMGTIWNSMRGTCHAMSGHRSLLMGVVWVWVQIRRKGWALVGNSKLPMFIFLNFFFLYTYGHLRILPENAPGQLLVCQLLACLWMMDGWAFWANQLYHQHMVDPSARFWAKSSPPGTHQWECSKWYQTSMLE